MTDLTKMTDLTFPDGSDVVRWTDLTIKVDDLITMKMDCQAPIKLATRSAIFIVRSVRFSKCHTH